MTPQPPGSSFVEVQNDRHLENLRKFQQINSDLGANTTLTRQALTESQSNRHQLKGLDESLKSLLHLFQEDKRERKEERAIAAAVQKEQSEAIRKLQQKFIWSTGLIAGLSIAFHEIGDLLSPLIRHLIQ